MSLLSKKIFRAASLVLDRGEVDLFKRLSAVGDHVARSDRTNTDSQLNNAIEDERSDEPPIEIVDADGDGKKEPPEEDQEEAEAEDVEGFTGFPMGALPQKERQKGPHPKDVSLGKPDWWNPR